MLYKKNADNVRITKRKKQLPRLGCKKKRCKVLHPLLAAQQAKRMKKLMKEKKLEEEAGKLDEEAPKADEQVSFCKNSLLC